jgi:hypothetical protein
MNISDISPKIIDKKSLELIEEFKEHFEQYKNLPEFDNSNISLSDSQRLVFEGWMIQKIASLQMLVSMLCGIEDRRSGKY